MPVRFGLIGCGKITERLALPQLSASADAAVGALVDIARPAAERLAEQFGIDRSRIWTDWKRMLQEAEVDAVGVNLPNALHAEVTIAALEAGKHVIVEKPIATTLAEADAMVEAARANQRFLMVEQPYRFYPLHEVAHDLLRSGALGRVTRLHGRIGHAGPEYWFGSKRTWLIDRAQSGGGALMDVGVHIVDLLVWLSGQQVRRVCCHAATLQKRVAVEDNATILLEFADGTLGACEASWTGRPYEVTARFHGERGTLRTSLDGPCPVDVRFCKFDGDPNEPAGERVRPEVPATSRFGGAYPYFADCIARGITPSISGEVGRAMLEVILAAYESARTGGWVDLPLTRRTRP